MKRLIKMMAVFIALLAATGCTQKSGAGFSSGPADMEPARFKDENALMEYLSGLDSENRPGCFTRLTQFPTVWISTAFQAISAMSIYGAATQG